MVARSKTKAELMAEMTVLRQRVADLEIEQQQREAELERWLAAERENWALAETLNQTGAAISSSLRGEEVLDRILEEMSRVVACEAACLLLIEEDVARVYRWRGYVRSGRATTREIISTVLRIDHIPALDTVREMGRPLAIPHPAPDEAWVRKFGSAWVKSYACAPIRSRGKVIGFLTVDSDTPDFFEQAEADTLQAFADQAARALENVGQHTRMRDEIVKRLKTLKKERNFISTILDTAAALVIALNRLGQIVHFNRACEQTSGYTSAEVKNRYVWDLLPPETASVVQAYFAGFSPGPIAQQASQLPPKFESYLMTKTGQQRLIAWSNATLFDKTGVVEYVIATGIDITEQRQAEAALQDSEARYRSVIAALAEGIMLQQQDGQIIACNSSAERILGLSATQMMGRTSIDPRWRAIHEDGSPFPGENHPAMVTLHTGQPQSNVIMGVHKPNGLLTWISVNAQPLFRETETTPHAVVASFTDITERKQAEEALKESEALLRATIEQVTVGINYASMDGRFFQVNDRFCQMVGYSRGELLSLGVVEVTHPDDLETDLGYLRQMEAGQINSYVIEKRYIHKNGSEVWVNLSVSLVHVPGSDLKYAVAVVEDISKRKQIEEELRRSHNFLQTLMDNLPVTVFVKSFAEGRFVLWNKASEKLFGIKAEEALGKTDLELFPREQAEFFRQKDQEVFEQQTLLDIPEEPVDSRDLGRRIVHTVKMPIYDEDKSPPYLLGIAEDITERKQAEEVLRQSEATKQAILAALPDLMFRLSREGVYLDVHAPHAADLVFPPSELLGKTLVEVLPLELAGQFLQAIKQVYQTEKIQSFEYQLLTQEGDKYFEARLVWSGLDEVLTIVRNITARKEAEAALRAQNEQLQARNQELDAFARTVAHDLKNPLGVLTTLAEILLEDYPVMPPEKLGEYLHSIARSGHRASQIVEALLLLAGVRQKNVSRQPLEMATIIAETLQRLTPMITQYQAQIITPSEWPVALGFAPWVEEVWANYLSNGLKYGGQPPRLELGASLQDEGMACFWVKDNGPGLSPAAQEQLFTEFTQLEPDRVDGYGLGLSIVRRIVEKLGGQVRVESTGIPGQGSTFSFTLPLDNFAPAYHPPPTTQQE